MSLVNVLSYFIDTALKKPGEYVIEHVISKLPETENRTEKLLLVHFLLLFLFSPIDEKWLIVFGPYCIISTYAQDYELKFTT